MTTTPPPARPTAAPYSRPTTLRRVWVPGIGYAGETAEEMAARERLFREEDARADAEEARLLAWKSRPWWEDNAEISNGSARKP
jgi:hypothetical protein